MARFGGLLAPTLVGLIVAVSFGAAVALFAALLALGAASAWLIRAETRGAPLE
jgi:putative MFS transporter